MESYFDQVNDKLSWIINLLNSRDISVYNICNTDRHRYRTQTSIKTVYSKLYSVFKLYGNGLGLTLGK